MVYLAVKQKDLADLIERNPLIFKKNKRVTTFVYTNVFFFVKSSGGLIGALGSMTFEVMKAGGRVVHHGVLPDINLRPSGLLTTKVIPELTHPYGKACIALLHPDSDPAAFHKVEYQHSTYNEYKSRLAIELFRLHLYTRYDTLNMRVVTKNTVDTTFTGSFSDKPVSTELTIKPAQISTLKYLIIKPVTPQVMYNQPFTKTKEILDDQRELLKKKFLNLGLALTDEQLSQDPHTNTIIVSEYIQQKAITEIIRKTSFSMGYSADHPDTDLP